MMHAAYEGETATGWMLVSSCTITCTHCHPAVGRWLWFSGVCSSTSGTLMSAAHIRIRHTVLGRAIVHSGLQVIPYLTSYIISMIDWTDQRPSGHTLHSRVSGLSSSSAPQPKHIPGVSAGSHAPSAEWPVRGLGHALPRAHRGAVSSGLVASALSARLG